jgi:sugar diacid utilization regulator
LKEGKVVAGEKGLDRIVSYVDILEVPDAINWLRGEELLLTTGYAIKDKPDVQENLILELARLNAAGIVIKLNRFLNDIPEIMIEKANEVNLPIIQLPPDIPYIEITHPLLKEILLRQNKEKWVNEKLKEILNFKFGKVDEVKERLISINSNFNNDIPMVLAIVSYHYSNDLSKLIKLGDIYQNNKIISGEVDGNFVIIYNSNFSIEWKKEVEDILFNPNSIYRLKDSDIVCIISRIIKNPLKLHTEYERLVNALKIIKKLFNTKKMWYFYDDIVHYIFLNNISNIDVVKEFVEYVLEPFKNTGEKDRELMINTLYAYVRNEGNISKASKDCFLHRNTLLYRMNKIREILNSSINSSDELFKYNLALTLYNFLRDNY